MVISSVFLSANVMADSMTYALKEGANIISTGLTIENLKEAVSTQNDVVAEVWGKKWDGSKLAWSLQTGGKGSDLASLTAGYGYFVIAKKAGNFTVEGDKGELDLLALREGLNLVAPLDSTPKELVANAVEKGRVIDQIWGKESGSWKLQTGGKGSDLTAYDVRSDFVAGYYVNVTKAPAAYANMYTSVDVESQHGKINVQGAPTGKIVEVYVDSLQDEAMSNDPLGTGAIPNDIKVPAFPAVAYLDTDGSGTVETAVVADSAYSGKKLYMTVSSWDSTAKEYTQKCAKIESLGLALSTADAALTAAACPGS